MSKGTNYLKLPSLKSIRISNYNLFEKDWEYEFKPGLNLFLGANGLGKTTTANMIAYAMVGDHIGDHGKIDSDYFKRRSRSTTEDEETDKKPPRVLVEFSIDSVHVGVERRLDRPEIVSFAIGDDRFQQNDVTDIKQLYEERLKVLTGLSSIEDLAFILKRLLIREEEGNYLLWSTEDQSRIIRLLLNYPSFDREFKKLEDKVTRAATKEKHLMVDKKTYQDRIKVLKVQIEATLDEISGQSKAAIQRQLRKKEDEIRILEIRRRSSVENLEYLTNERRTLESRISAKDAALERKAEDAAGLEMMFFSSVYSDPKVLLAAHKLKTYRLCMFCENEISSSKAEEISNKIEHRRRCPVCTSTITDDSSPALIDNGKTNASILGELNSLTSEIEELKSELERLTAQVPVISSRIEEEWLEVKNLDRNLDLTRHDLDDLRLQFASIEETDSYSDSRYDRDIAALERSIEDLDDEIMEAREERAKLKKRLESKNQKLNKRIETFTDGLNNTFNRYASFFPEDCRLQADERGTKGSDVKLKTFRPVYAGKLRPYQSSASKSELIFLEYLFRMALLEYYASNAESGVFLIIETSEGTFDIPNTRQVAKALAKFGRNVFPFLTITNLSKPDFISELLSECGDKQERTLNFLEIGKLSSTHLKDHADLQKALGIIFET